ncbi:LytR C-terminal domain-containing protein [Demequina sp.]|uniref:LytR C-terminal domain-containing protein n=1 Tax=Demequina sp. TaxID=2050685 RepID=UPI0025D7AB0D|nr:LytR C-terminal domain-containing protein [Demequina sp.]
MTNEYERDEFDEIGERGGPVGVHRAPRPWWHLVVIPLIVFLIAGLLAFLVATFLWNSGETGQPGASASATPSASTSASPSPDASATAAPSETSSPEPSETSTPEPVIEFGTPIAVLNGTGISGLAGAQQQILEEGGFTSVTAANLSGTKPDANLVVYNDESLRDTALEVAAQLGIDNIELGNPGSDADVEVQLVTDPS